MSYILDTDTIIYYFKGNEKLNEHISKCSIDKLNTTIINHAELYFGAYHSNRKKENIDLLDTFFSKINVLDLCHESSKIFGEQKAILKKSGNNLADMDLMIASICIQNSLTLVTNNFKHFERLKNLNIENWIK